VFSEVFSLRGVGPAGDEVAKARPNPVRPRAQFGASKKKAQPDLEEVLKRF
jgi:hypothetical protein